MISEKDEIVLFENGELALEVNVSPQLETVWLSSNQMALLYGRDEKTIRKHVNKIFADDFGEMPVMKVSAIGYGMGKKR